MRKDTKLASPRLGNYLGTDHLKTGLRRRALRGATAAVVAQIVAFAAQISGSLILARLLTPDDFGLVTMVLAFSMLLQNFGVNGFTEAIIQIEEITDKQVSTVFWINLGFSVTLAFLFILSSSAICWFYSEPRLKAVVAVMSIPIVLTALSIQHLALLKRRMEFRKVSANDVIAAIVSMSIAVVLAWRGWGYWALVAKWMISALAVTIGAWILCGWRPGLPTRGTRVMHIMVFAFHTYGNFVITYLRRTIDKMLIGRIYGSHSLGSYDRAYQLSNMLPGQILNPLHSIAISTFSRLRDDPEKYRYYYLKVLACFSFAAMPLSAILTVSSADVVLLFLGPQWKEAGEIFRAFGLSIGVIVIYMTHGWLHLSLGTPHRWFYWSIMELVATVVCLLVGLRYGALGVAFAFSASFYILIGPALWYAGKPINLTLSSVLSEIWRHYVSALVAGLLCWNIFYSGDWAPSLFTALTAWSKILVSAAFCTSTYLVLVVVLYQGIRPISEFISVLREIVSKD